MKFIVLIFFICLFLLLYLNKKENFNDNDNIYYKDLTDNWNSIFPDGNRNAAGYKFFKYIIDKKNISYNDFLEYNKMYCAVSGSLVSPGSESEFIYLKDLDGNNICGNYYKCCWPCSCDLMKYAKTTKITHSFTDGEKSFYVLLIDNPCTKNNFPKEVNKQYMCTNNSLNFNNVFTVKGKLVIGLLHEGRMCLDSDLQKINNHEITGNHEKASCFKRNMTDLDELQYGMGDIFIKLAN